MMQNAFATFWWLETTFVIQNPYKNVSISKYSISIFIIHRIFFFICDEIFEGLKIQHQEMSSKYNIESQDL